MAALLLTLLAVPLVTSQHVHFEPPWVSSVVASVTSQFAPWITPAPGNYYHHPPDHNHTNPYPFQHPPPQQQDPCSFWLENISHQGKAPFQSDPNYQVFRNVKDYGAKGDGLIDDTAAINAAISAGNRCAPGSCASTTTTPALVYFPNGTYVVSSSIIDYYYTQVIGNPNCMPVIQASANFTSAFVIDADPYGANGLSYGSTNVFYRQIRNLEIDMSNVPAAQAVTGIHWPTAQATSLQNIVFYMSQASGTQHIGVLIEEGSGGFMTDLVTFGGLYGYNFGNQQFTMRNLTANNAVTGINQLWDWGWTYKGVTINNCSVGLNMSSGGTAAQSVESIVFFDSTMTNTPIGILTAHDANSQPPAAGSLIIENCQFNNVPSIVQGPDGTVLAGSAGSVTVAGWGEGHAYTPTGPQIFEGPITPNTRPASLVQNGVYYQRSKPQYEQYSASAFLSARSAGATGDGHTDDTRALQSAIYQAAFQHKILFLDAGDYLVTSTVYFPANSKVVGEAFPVILGSGPFFSNAKSPQPVVQMGRLGERGSVEFSDVIVSGQGAVAGAIFIEYNLAASAPAWGPWSPPTGPHWGPKQPSWQPQSTPSGLWDMHIRVGGFAGSNLQIAQCPTTPTVSIPPASVNTNCIAGFMSMHITSTASNLYMENNWFWTADHDIEDPTLRQITIYNGRGLYIDSSAGTIWLYGTAVEHHTLYEYQLSNVKNVFMGQIQTETAYYQPNPPAPLPVGTMASWNDPVFPAFCYNATGASLNFTVPGNFSNTCDGWGLRVINAASDIYVYGAGLYSFFDNYNTTCSAAGNGESCQKSIFSVEGGSQVSVYNLNTVGSQSMVDVNGQSVASYADNVAGFTDTIAIFRTSGSI